MKKFTAQVISACPFHSASEQAKTWNHKKTMLIILSDDGVLYIRDQDNNHYRPNTKWRKMPMHWSVGVDERLKQLNASPGSFRGAPRGI